MSLKDIVQKLKESKGEREVKEGLTPDETELLSYKKKEYHERVKRELQRYREKERQVLWKGRKMNDEHQIIKAPNVFKRMKNIFNKKRSNFITQTRSNKKDWSKIKKKSK